MSLPIFLGASFIYLVSPNNNNNNNNNNSYFIVFLFDKLKDETFILKI